MMTWPLDDGDFGCRLAQTWAIAPPTEWPNVQGMSYEAPAASSPNAAAKCCLRTANITCHTSLGIVVRSPWPERDHTIELGTLGTFVVRVRFRNRRGSGSIW